MFFDQVIAEGETFVKEQAESSWRKATNAEVTAELLTLREEIQKVLAKYNRG
jgi:hypothetical protein